MFQFFHICNHSIPINNALPHIRSIEIKNDGDDVDVIFSGGIVKEIKSIRAITYTPRVDKEEFEYDSTKDQRYEDSDAADGYYDGNFYNTVDYSKFFSPNQTVSNPLPTTFYRSFLHNRIKWNVEPPLTYVAEVVVQFSNKRTSEYPLSECPRCQGKGWFVDILNEKGKFQLDVGVMKVAQRVVKDLLTELQSSVLNLQYGTLIKQSISGVSKDDDAIFDDIRLILSEVEDRYLLRQQEEYNSLSEDERLVKLWLLNLSRSKQNARTIVLDLQIETEEESKTLRFSL